MDTEKPEVLSGQDNSSLYETLLNFSTPEEAAKTLLHFDSLAGKPPNFETLLNFESIPDAVANLTILHVDDQLKKLQVDQKEAAEINDDVAHFQKAMSGISTANAILHPDSGLIRKIRSNTARVTLYLIESMKKMLLNREFSRDVGRFWLREIAQPAWHKDENTGREELEQTILDPDLNREFGSYALTCDWKQSEDELSITDAEPGNVIGLLLFEQLTDLAITRRKFRKPISQAESKANLTETRVPVCLPNREEYSITLWKGSAFKKINVPESLLHESGKPTFLDTIRTALLKTDGWKIASAESMKSAVDKAYDGNATMQGRENDRLDPDRFDVADLSLVITPKEQLDVAEIQADPRGTFGINIPVTLHVGTNPDGRVSSIGAKFSHPYTDGAYAKDSLVKTITKIAESNNLQALKKKNVNSLVAFILGEKNNKNFQLPETMLQFAKEYEQTPVHFELKLESSQLDILKKVTEYFKERVPKVDVSIHAIFHMALMAYLFIDKAHYLEADKSEEKGKKRNDLVPALSVFPVELISKIREGTSLDFKEQQRLLTCLEFLQDQRDQVRNGWGTARVSAAIVGRMRDLITVIGEYIDPAGTSLTAKIRLMTSMLVSRKTMSTQHAISTSGFMTAINSNYTNVVAGVTEKGSNAFEMCFRARADASTQLDTLKQEDFQKMVAQILSELAKISDQAK